MRWNGFSRHAVTMLTVLAAAVLGGCNSYQKRFDAVVAQPPPAEDITGAWTGTWKSQPTGHSGELLAIITKIDEKTYHVDYHATWGEVLSLSFEHSLDFTPQMQGGTWRFGGEHDLGFPYGHYSYTATATSTEYQAEYKTKDDHGTYRLSRPAPVAAK